jgi:hypothetical protein
MSASESNNSNWGLACPDRAGGQSVTVRDRAVQRPEKGDWIKDAHGS